MLGYTYFAFFLHNHIQGKAARLAPTGVDVDFHLTFGINAVFVGFVVWFPL
jgi:hypothetical protein